MPLSLTLKFLALLSNPALPGDWPRTISISTLGFSPKVRRISAAQKEQLLASGRQGVRAFFATQSKLK